jgi:hypothetical protein
LKQRLSIMAVAILLGGLASSQTNAGPVGIDDSGAVIPSHQHRHVKNGEALSWSRTAAGRPWQVQFGVSPCANGVKLFGSAAGQPKTCVVTVHCATPGHSSCVYQYSSSAGANEPLHDPDVIVDN